MELLDIQLIKKNNNCNYVINPLLGHVAIISNRQINSGDECCISYGFPYWFRKKFGVNMTDDIIFREICGQKSMDPFF